MVNEGVFVCKFGGSSLADSDGFRRVNNIVKSDPRRQLVVVSAPGKRHKNDEKITDLFYQAQADALSDKGITTAWEGIKQRFMELAYATNYMDVAAKLAEVRHQMLRGCTPEYAASRGEYLNAIVLAHVLGFEFIDAAEVIRFTTDGELDPITYALIRQRCEGNHHYVIPGFYGQDNDGCIRTFSRGGSDITGSILATGVDAEVYENWTDVSGLLVADPRIIPKAAKISKITYKELRELTYMGATVFHNEAVAPVWKKGIPIHIRNTFDPEGPSTLIVASKETTQQVVGIAGKTGFAVVNIAQVQMHDEIGIAAKILKCFADLGISIEHAPTAIDEMSVIIRLNGKLDLIQEQLRKFLPNAEVTFGGDLALIATVGLGMVKKPGTAAKLFWALAQHNINVRVILQGASENNIIVGVNEADMPSAIRCIYQEFFGKV